MGAVTMPQLATIFAMASTEIKHSTHQILEEACELFQYSAQTAIGSGDNPYGWAPLAESTIARKTGTILLETGALLGSITHNVDPMANVTGEAYIGTDLEYAKYLEYGTSKMPARPFLGGAIIQEEKHIPEIVHKALAKLFP